MVQRSFSKLKTKPVEGDTLIGYSKECSQILTAESNGAIKSQADFNELVEIDGYIITYH